MSSSDALESIRPELHQALQAVDQALMSGERNRLDEVLEGSDKILAMLEPIEAVPEVIRIRAIAHMKRGHAQEAMGEAAKAMEAIRSYEQAIKTLQGHPREGFPALEMAVSFMHRGNVLQRFTQPEAIEESIKSYDQSVALMANLPADAPAELHNLSGSIWMSRGGICMRKGGEEALGEALRSFEEASKKFEPLAAEHEAARRNLASAAANCGLVYAQQNMYPQATKSYKQAIEILSSFTDTEGPALPRDLAGMYLNLGQARWGAKDHVGAGQAFDKALSTLEPYLNEDPGAADLSLRIRHAYGVVMGALLATERARTPLRDERLAFTGDLVEDGFALLKEWGEKAQMFREAALRLFDFGVWFYRTQQPQFLSEFLMENVSADDAQRREIASKAVAMAKQELVQRGFGGSQSIEEIMAGLREVEEKLLQPAS